MLLSQVGGTTSCRRLDFITHSLTDIIQAKMKILYRNFIKLLSFGAFDTAGSVEPMSEYKWNKLLLVAKTFNAQDFISNGICKAYKADEKSIPSRIHETAQGYITATPTTADKKAGKITNTYHRKEKKFANPLLNRKYNNLVFDEIHSIDTSIESLMFMNKLIDNINTILNSCINFKTLAELGSYLRESGDKIDFVKIDKWIKALRIRKLCDLIGHYLILVFGFEAEELPFIKSPEDKQLSKVSLNLEHYLQGQHQSVRIEQERPGNLNPVSRPNTHPMKYFSYHPIETSSRMVANIVKSLSNIDE